MPAIAHFGTFDVENFGDLLFPAILERRLRDLGHEFVHVSPHGGPPVWGDCVATVAADAVIDDPSELAGVIVGGGHIIHTSPATLDRYEQGGLSANLAYPSLWIGAAYLASQQNVPYCWNAPGVPQSFSPAGARLAEWATSLADYLAVRDRASHSRLVDAGVSRIVRVVPDTALEIVHLWSAEELETAFADLFVARGREVPARSVVIHLNRRYAGEDAAQLAARLDRIAQHLDATPILIAMGPCHGDDLLQREIGQLMTVDAVVIDRPQSLRQIAACIAKAEAYLGSSLHGMVTACSFGTKGMVIVPPSAGTYGKFIGFLEQFQLTTWMADTWEDAEQRLDELISAPGDPWSRVLEATMPVLDEHWDRIGSVLASPSRSKRGSAARVDKQGAIDRLASLSGPMLSPTTTIYAPIIAEQAIRATQNLNLANEQRREKEKVLAEQKRLLAEIGEWRKQAEALQEKFNVLQDEVGALRAAGDQSSRSLDELREERDRLRTELDGERDRLQAEILAVQSDVATEREKAAQALTERAHYAAELANERKCLREEIEEERQRHRAEIAIREKSQEQEEAAQLAQLQAVVGNVLQREDAYLDSMRKAEERLARIDTLLAGLAGRTTTKKSAKRVLLARRELRAARRDLTDRSLVEQPSSRRSNAPSEVARLFLPGRLRPGMQHDGIADEGAASGASAGALVDIVVCVHNALDDVQRCLASLVRHTGGSYQVIVVDDGSDPECAAYLQEFARLHPRFSVYRNDAPQGYTRAANLGLRLSSAEFVVLLNSDTVVTDHWLERLVECAESDPAIGIVGPLSNAASYQSAPRRADESGDWSQNPLPSGWDLEQVAAAVAEVADRAFPRVPFVNGFCFAITRAAINAIGSFDEDAFPEGYGEENDYCLRAAEAGFALAIADHAYVYHAKSRSYSHERRRELGKLGRSALLRKHSRERVEANERALRDDPILARVRQALEQRLQGVPPETNTLSVLFLLPVGGGGGGAHSIVQEATGMRRLGFNAQVAIKARHLPHYRNTYPSLAEAEELFFGFGDEDELADHAARFSVVVATIHTSVPLLAAIAEANPWVIPAYYIQDYEPFFYAEDSPERDEAARSYTAIPGALLFAKTQWLCDTVSALHGVQVHKVSPSLDHDVYFPAPGEREGKRVRVAAMIRPRSRRRGAQRTMEVLQRLTEEFAKGVDVHIFGCMDADIKSSGLPHAFRCKNHGILKREEVAEVLRKADVFLDLSDYQAFGRTGLEAMACGCAVVVPALGGSGEYAVHGENALVVDTSCVDECFEAAQEVVQNEELRSRFQEAGLTKSATYSVAAAAKSELNLFLDIQRSARRGVGALLHGGNSVRAVAVSDGYR